jgi:hypothetical protein
MVNVERMQTNECQNKLQQLKWQAQGNERQRSEIAGMEEDCTGSQGPQRTAAFEEEKNEGIWGSASTRWFKYDRDKL